jgi:ABC-type transporter Mla subunit MlaD
MSNPIFDRISNLKPIRLGRVAVVIAASFILMLGTACNPSSPSLSGTGSYQEGRQPQTELYRPIQPSEGGMNQYSDTDPRYNTKGLKSEIKARVDQADRNIQKVDNPEEFAEDYRKGTPLGERVRNITDSIGGAAKGTSEDFAEGTQRGVRNLKQNVNKAAQGAQETVDEARSNAADLGKDTSRTAQRTTDQLKGNLDNARRDVQQNVKGLKRDMSYNAERGTGQVGSSVDVSEDKQATPRLDAGDLIERAKDAFSTATQNVAD